MISRFKEITPNHLIRDCSLDELLSSCQTAFTIIGYAPKNLENSFNTIFENVSVDKPLYRFIYEVYVEDKT